MVIMKKRDIIIAHRITGSKGGKKAAASMTKEQLSERAKKAAAARWAKKEGKK
jgi:hypothetical protein